MKPFEQRVAQILGNESKLHPIHARFLHNPVIQELSRMRDCVSWEQDRCQVCQFSVCQARFIPRPFGRSRKRGILERFSVASWA